MGETKIIVLSRHWPKTLLQKFQQVIGLRPKKAGRRFCPFSNLVKKR
ncbi:MAG: hypothetical protein RJR37_04270 [Peptococcaceae bacterium MAG4]|nr:hypothetical protein [Peptococcaceae bacterium MAG4]NLW39094.1 hypothetical protein [Peptococcaceae bacterium]